GSRTAGHPEFGHAPGIETTTGPLGQGLANAVGMALAERLMNARYGDGLVDHHTYAIVGDGCLMEGISHEAVALAGHLKLGKLIVLFDDNSISIDGAVSLSDSVDQLKRFVSCGWATTRVDGHDPDAVAAALETARKSDRPSLIACRTIIGYGAPKLAGTAKTHGGPLGAEEIAGARAKLDWPHAPFEIPAEILGAWRATGKHGARASAAWDGRFAAAPAETRARYAAETAGELPASLGQALAAYKAKVVAEQPKLATRVSSQKTIEVLAAELPALVGGSADLTGSNGTKVSQQKVIAAGQYGGNYVHYGVREHAMAAVMNGLALHGGVIPYGGSFLIFTDYCRPSIRLSALMGLRVIYVMTHDSIGLGEDGPTHQPVEQLASLRAMPNLLVFRPADAIETAECWELALSQTRRPSVIALSRQNLPNIRLESVENLSAYGGYILRASEGQREVTLIATGSEIEIAMEAQTLLRAEGVESAVVSLPCWELFAEQPQHYRDEVLSPGALRIAIEAASPLGWERWLGEQGAFIGMRSFGASAPAEALYKEFGITAAAVVEAVKAHL
ncbi:MAG: transketolase family protein, partial [Kiloniellales bacterium]